MKTTNLYRHQKDALEATKQLNHCAYYHPMGSGKTFTGSEKLYQLGAKVNLVICQKSKIEDWIEHFRNLYPCHSLDLTDKTGLIAFWEYQKLTAPQMIIGVINYELAFRRPELLQLKNFTLMLDESSLIQNEKAKRSKFILKLQPKNVILLSGTPVGGKYERLISQMHLLGWKISEKIFYNQYVDYHYEDVNGFPLMVIDGYKNVDRLKRKMRAYGCHFLQQEDLFELPEQVEQTIRIPTTKEYRIFRKDCIVKIPYSQLEPGKHPDGTYLELVGDSTLTKMLYERQLCGQYNTDKLEAFRDLVESTEDRLIVFYNFNAELNALFTICKALERPISVVNGAYKGLYSYENCSDSITFIQYQAGAMGLN